MAGKKKAPPAFIAAGIAALRKVNAQRHLVPRCKAMSRTTGQQCRQFAMPNGCCYYHGGRTPKGKDWHRRQWKYSEGPNAQRRLRVKLEQIARAASIRDARLARMTPEQRARFDLWHRQRPVGTPAQRMASKAARQRNADFRARQKSFAKNAFVASPELQEIEQRIADLRAQLAFLRADRQATCCRADADPADPSLWSIFG